MKKIGEFWVPDIDMAPGRNSKKSRIGFEKQAGIQIWHLERALKFVPGRKLAVDGGANVGAWSKYMASCFDKVISFEPNPVVYECLKQNIVDWRIDNIVETYPNAISNKKEFVCMERRCANARTVTGRITGAGDIECKTIDSLNLSSCSFLKFDLEGYEPQGIEGSSKTIEKYRPWILIENKRTTEEIQNGGSQAELLLKEKEYKLIEKIGYDEIDWLYRPN